MLNIKAEEELEIRIKENRKKMGGQPRNATCLYKNRVKFQINCSNEKKIFSWLDPLR